ncbi:MarR family winged helix-turn-helix transcriptional regulator [Streptomyces sp. NPDC058691]|uniref:MarR family winged helix-turn-helix transcriptional regulator n=1 Tax=Streptomyces sp. NPDC058691 TaxID=3346601 RepID=UPI0036519C23
MTSQASAPAAPAAPAVPDLTGLLQHASHALTNRLATALGEIGLSPRGYCVLLHAQPGLMTQAQLAEVSQQDKTTMVVTVDELERAGLAERHPSPTDRRARIITVTDAGCALVARGQQITARVHGEVLEALPDAERAVFVAALQRLVGGHLATTMDSPRPVRRARQPRQ